MAKKTVTEIALREGGLEWTHLKHGEGGRLHVAGSGSDTQPVMDDQWPTWQEALSHTTLKIHGEIRVVLPASDVLLRVMTLPTIDQDEIEGMVELQLDEFSPFPLEQLYIGFEVLHRDEQQSRVVVAAAKRKPIDALGEEIRGAGGRIAHIDLDMLCWWEVLKPEDSSGRQIHLIREERALALVISDDGLPVHMGTIEDVAPQGTIDWQDVAEDLEMALLSVESEYGPVPVEGVELWHSGEVPEGLEDLKGRSGWQVTAMNFTDERKLPVLALRRGLSSDRPLMDLVPAAWKDAEATRLLKQQFLRTAAGMVAVWLILASLGGLMVQFGKSRAKKLENRFAEIQAPARQVEEMRRKIESLSQFTNQTYSALECLRESAVLLPPDVELTSWSYRKGRGISLKGKAPNNSPAFAYNGKLAESDLFAEVINGGGSVSRSGGWEFKASALLPNERLP